MKVGGMSTEMTERRFTIHLLPEPEGGFTVRVPALPPVVTYGATYEEALANAREAIEAVIEVYREDGIEIPPDIQTRIDILTIAA
jgi:antitoxin HicB